MTQLPFDENTRCVATKYENGTTSIKFYFETQLNQPQLVASFKAAPNYEWCVQINVKFSVEKTTEVRFMIGPEVTPAITQEINEFLANVKCDFVI